VLIVSSICALVSTRSLFDRERFLYDFAVYSSYLAIWGIYLTKAVFLLIIASLAASIHTRDNDEHGLLARKIVNWLSKLAVACIVLLSTASFAMAIYLKTISPSGLGVGDVWRIANDIVLAIDVLFLVGALGLTATTAILLKDSSLEMKRVC
jgi:hypothetical protein